MFYYDHSCLIIVPGINRQILQNQYLTLHLIKGMRVLFGYQHLLHKIMLHSFHMNSSPIENDGSQSSSVKGSNETTDNSLLQYLMSAASQPSPLKSIFSWDEIEVINPILFFVL